MPLSGRTILITGGARRLGRTFALAMAQAGGRIILHHGHSPEEAERLREEITNTGGEAYIVQADLYDSSQTAYLVDRAWEFSPLDAVVNNAAIFEDLHLLNTGIDDWNLHMQINLTAPFLISQAFARRLGRDREGRIVNILDWRALRPAADHFPYTISKAGLAALTRSLALALAPHITVNALALGAILPPSNGEDTTDTLQHVPAGRWAELDEVSEALLFLLSGPAYITGEILHIDGGRHLA